VRERTVKRLAWLMLAIVVGAPDVSSAVPAWRVGGDAGVFARDEAGGPYGVFPVLQLRLAWNPMAWLSTETGYSFIPAPALVPPPSVDMTYHRLFARALARIPTNAGAILVGAGPVMMAGEFTIRDVSATVTGLRTSVGVGGGVFYEHELGAWGVRTGLELQWTPDRLDAAVTIGGAWGPGGETP